MKVFSKIRHTIIGDRVEIHTHYFIFNWNFWTSVKQEEETTGQSQGWASLKQGTNGHLEIDE